MNSFVSSLFAKLYFFDSRSSTGAGERNGWSFALRLQVRGRGRMRERSVGCSARLVVWKVLAGVWPYAHSLHLGCCAYGLRWMSVRPLCPKVNGNAGAYA